MGHPYRDRDGNSLKPDERGVEVSDFDVSDIVVEVIWQNRVGDIAFGSLEFKGQDNHYGPDIYILSPYSCRPYLESGKDRLDAFLRRGSEKGFIYVKEHAIPWNRIFQFKIVSTVERKTSVKWRHKPADP